jgi:hypothetical protein
LLRPAKSPPNRPPLAAAGAAAAAAALAAAAARAAAFLAFLPAGCLLGDELPTAPAAAAGTAGIMPPSLPCRQSVDTHTWC